jgi:hypothetical protein
MSKKHKLAPVNKRPPDRKMAAGERVLLPDFLCPPKVGVEYDINPQTGNYRLTPESDSSKS